jgi:hypothetical protein
MKGHRAWGNAAGSGQLAASMLEVGGALRSRLEVKIIGMRTGGSNY